MKLRPNRDDLPQIKTLEIRQIEIRALTPNPRNVRKHPAGQLEKLARNIQTFGFTAPLVVDQDFMILAGHARFEAAKRIGLKIVPGVLLDGLTDEQKTAFAIFDNKIGDESSFDAKGLKNLLNELAAVDFDMAMTGFEVGEIDFHLDGAAGEMRADPDDRVAPTETNAVTNSSDMWLAGTHRILCGNALDAASYERVLGGEKAAMIFADPPYNCPIDGHVSGLGEHHHREFAMASGEMTRPQFRTFLADGLRRSAGASVEGAILFVCMDWRNIDLLLEVGGILGFETKNLCVWVKSNAGMGSLYRSQHELVAVFKKPGAPHRNNIELGKHGRHRSNVWEYGGANAFSATRKQDLAAHPTPKPVAMVADAIRDVTKRGDVVLDPFVGSGTTVLAAERSGRRAAALELDPLYVDVTIRRWQRITGKKATLEGDGRTFDEVAIERLPQDGEAAR